MDLCIVGTDTDCGKTVVSSAVVAALGAADTVVIKPVQTGFPPDDDAAKVAAATGCRAVTLETFTEPLTPAVCAVREGRSLDVEDLVRRTLAVEATHRVVETAGGLLAPLVGDVPMAALVAALGIDVILAVRPALGTLNHTALTLEAMTARGIVCRGLVVSGFRGGVVEETNLEILATYAPLLGVLPRYADPADAGRPDTSVWRVALAGS